MPRDAARLPFLLRHPDYGRYWIGSLLAASAAQIEAVTIGWQIYSVARRSLSIEQSAFLVGMVGLAQFVPMFLLTLYAGAVADRHKRSRIVALAVLVLAICDIGLVALALTPHPSFHAIFMIAAVFGAARAFLMPAASSMVPMLVPRSEMPRAISLNSLTWQLAVIVGPMLGGLLCAISPAVSYGVTALLYLAALIPLLLLRTDTTPQRQPGSRLRQIREGLVYLWSNQIVLGAISLDLFAGLLGGATALLPAFASDILHVGPHGFGLLRSAPAIGAVLMALALSRWPLIRHAGARMFWAVAGCGLLTVGFALSTSLWISVLALAAFGAADMISVYVRGTLIQIVTPDHMRGRVSAVSGLFISGSNELGEFESGVVARLIGPVGAAVFGGIGTLVVTGAWTRIFPALRRADRLDAPIPEVDGSVEKAPLVAQ